MRFSETAIQTAIRPAALTMPRKNASPAEVGRAARDMEGLFLNLLWKEMLSTAERSGGSFFPEGLAGDIYKGFLTQAYAEKMAEAGGIGLAALISSQLNR